MELTSNSEWAYDAETKNMIQDLAAYREANNDTSDKVSLGVNWLFEPSVNFYRVTDNHEWLLPADREGISNKYHFIYTFQDEIRPLDSANYTMIKKYENTETILVKTKRAPTILDQQDDRPSKR